MSSVRKLIRLLLTLLLSVQLYQVHAQETQSTRFLLFTPAVVDIGDVDASEKMVSVPFTFTNISGSDIQLLDVHSQCSCTKPVFSKKKVPSGKESSLRVVLFLEDLTGPQKRHLTVISTDGEKRRFSTITIICNVIR